MRLNLRRFLAGFLVVAVLILSVGISPAEAAHKKKRVHQQPNRYAAIVIEASTGYVLSAENADKRLYPASLTKMMTLYLTFEALTEGRITKNQRITASRRAAAQEPSSLGLVPGDDIRVEDAILSIATKSANDSAVALAEAIGGSEDRFARAMTAKARKLGMNNTRFVNASGLFNASQFSTARDMATLSQALVRDYPKHYRYFSTNTFTYKDNTYMNHNKLMSSYEGMDGLKTGYVYASGYNLAASAVRNGTRLIGVVFGGRTARSRNDTMAKLLNKSFERISDVRVASLAKKGQAGQLPVRRPATIQSMTEVASIDAPNAYPDTGASLSGHDLPVIDQGDTDIVDDNRAVRITRGNPPVGFQLPILTPATALAETPQEQPQPATDKEGGWAIQIGAFASRDASLKATEAAKSTLQGKLRDAVSVAAPLMTNRGMIYRARLSGIARNAATEACRILRGSCLILTAD